MKSEVEPNQIVPIPRRLLDELAAFRRALLQRVIQRGVLWCLVVSSAAIVALMLIDRFVDTPVIVRLGLCLVVLGCFVIAVVRVIGVMHGSRNSIQVARRIKELEPVFGDHLLGALELTQSESEQSRSASLCAAALEQVADETQRRDLKKSIPRGHQRAWYWSSGLGLAALVLIGVIFPSLLMSSCDRLARPFADVTRFTFVDVEDFSQRVIVPRDEESVWMVSVREDSHWRPAKASLQIGLQSVVSLAKSGEEYSFEIPKLIEPVEALLAIGDARKTINLIPRVRPTLSQLSASVTLPSYLGGGVQTQELHGGVLEMIKGSRATVQATASTKLRAAKASSVTESGSLELPTEVRETTARVSIPGEAAQVEIVWWDDVGLELAEPIVITRRWIEDDPPTLLVHSDPVPEKVLESHPLAFDLVAEDDYGVRQVSMEWSTKTSTGVVALGGKASTGKGKVADGETVVGQEFKLVELASVFQADSLDLATEKVTVRFSVVDELPGRDPVYSSPITLDVLSASEHAVWIADEFEKWRQAAMDVRDRELNLYQRNRQLNEVPLPQRDAAWIEDAKRQARDEQLNGRLLGSLTNQGEQLLRQAARNAEVSADYVQTLAETIETLESLAADSMPGVAEGLAAAASEAEAELQEESKFAAMTDQETSQGNSKRKLDQKESSDASESGATKERIGLAGTTVVDTTKRQKEDDPKKTEVMVEVLDDQATLVAEFDSVAEQLSALLGKMEGSTLVKRLKSISRLQDRVAVNLGREIGDTFGEPARQGASVPSSIRAAAIDVSESAKRIRTVLDDLDALCERREIEHFKVVLEEMKSTGVLDQMQALSRVVLSRPGLAISATEYWADNLDRWADDLIDPRGGESKAGVKTTKSLPPEVILEVLRVLELEVGLRDRTRVAEQSRRVASRDQYMSQAIRLSEDQDLLRDRVDVVVQKLESEAEGVMHYASEIEVLAAASAAMVDASKTLVQPETGPAAIAAETEAIELLLRSKKVSPDSGGGGGSTAGGGSGGTTEEAAERLLGRGLNELATLRESETELSVGRNRDQIPVQWREGLDAYFQGMEKRRRGLGKSGARQ